MSDVRLVSVEKGAGGFERYERDEHGDRYEVHNDAIVDDPNGTHLLVPVEEVYADEGGWLIRFSANQIDACPTCGGSGTSQEERECGMMDMGGCPDCNGCGWRLSDE